MAQICIACGELNPATNRYCGQCGDKLERAEIQAPQELRRKPVGEDRAGQVEASSDLPTEVIGFDKQLSLIAAKQTDRRRYAPPEMLERVHDDLGREAELHDSLRQCDESHLEAQAKEKAAFESRMQALLRKEAELERMGVYLPWSANNAVSKDVNEPASVGDSGTVDTVIDAAAEPGVQLRLDWKSPIEGEPVEDERVGDQPVQSEKAAREAVGDETAKDENETAHGEKIVRTGMRGLSILGLTDNPFPEYEDEEREPESHSRRNVALGLLAAAVILVALQWRDIRDFGMAYVPTGSMAANQPEVQAPSAPPMVAAGNTGTHSGRSRAASSAHQALKPQAAKKNLSPGRELATRRATNSSKPRQSAPALASRRQPAAMSAPTAEAPKGEPAAASQSPTPHSSPAAAPGADEMNRADRADDAQIRVFWLWKAISKGNPEAPVALANMYEQGNGVVRSCDQARILLRSAAAEGNEQAMLRLQQLHCSSR